MKYNGADARKFVITNDGELIYGGFVNFKPYIHKDLLAGETTCNGGGILYVFSKDKIMLMCGESYDFGKPQFDKWTSFMGNCKDWKWIYKTDLNSTVETLIDTNNVDFWD